MEKTGRWGDAGEQQVKLSFCRNVLQMEPDAPINQEHAQQFHETVSLHLAKLGLDKLSVKAAKGKIESMAISVFDRTFSIHDFSELNTMLRETGSDHMLQGGMYGYEKEFIFGIGTAKKMDAYDVFFMNRELVRSPNTIVAMAAVIGDKDVFVRRESLVTIFHQKWMAFAESPHTYHPTPFHEIADGIKQKVLDFHGGIKQEPFIEEMGETILFHELGHGVIQHHVLPAEIGALAESSKVCGENSLTALLEILAEIAPRWGSIKGPLQNMADVARTDPARATRMYWMYFSDTWFFDTEDHYMYLYSDLMALIVTTFIRADQSVDFEALEGGEILEWVVRRVTETTLKLKDLLLVSGQPADESYSAQTEYWTKCLDETLKDPAKAQAIQAMLEQDKAQLVSDFLLFTAGRFGDSRDYLVERCREIIKIPA